MKELITEISATLSFSALQNNDKVGVILFSDQIELFTSSDQKPNEDWLNNVVT